MTTGKSKSVAKRAALLAIVAVAAVLLAVVGLERAHMPGSGSETEAAPEESIADYSILIIVIDALRADHLGCYGYARDTSPFIDSIASQGVVFEEAISCSSFTCESVSALFTGLLPSRSGTGVGWLAKPYPYSANLAELFAKGGYVTGFFTDSPALYDPMFDKGFHETDHLEKAWGKSGGGVKLTHRALDFAQKNRGKKTAMYLHYLDPHAPYEPSREAYLKFADTVYPEPLRLYDQVRPCIVELVQGGFGPGDPRFEDLVLRYDAEIAQNDEAIRLLFEGLNGIGVLDKTLVILTADHGQEFLDHGYVEHAWRLYRESIHVPLVFWAPGIFKPEHIASPVSHIQLLPTLIEIAGVNHARRDLASPFFRWNGAQLGFVPPQKPLIAELLLETRSQLRTVMDGDHKYMAAQRWLTPAQCSESAKTQMKQLDAIKDGSAPRLDVWQEIVHEEIYEIANDPAETRNLLEETPPKLADLRAAFEEYKASCQGVRHIKPRAPVHVSPELQQQLDALGYGDSSKKKVQ